jgi:hypothetical protein
MKRKTAVSFFLGVCIFIAAFLVTHLITLMLGEILFAIALVTFGGLSRGFRGKDIPPKTEKVSGSQ